MRAIAARAWFVACLTLGRLLRVATYARVRVVRHDDVIEVRKQRVPHAPVLLWMGGPLLRMLDTGVRVLSRRDWEQRERRLYHDLYGASIRIDADGTLVLPCLTGAVLATLLDDATLAESERTRAIELAVVALAALHARGVTHGDAMAENVMVDLEGGIARWFDFETVHEPGRSMAWRRADDVRALLATCVLRVASERLGGTVRLIVGTYGDEHVTRLVAASFASPFRWSLAFHLGQGPLPFEACGAVTLQLRERTRE